MFSVAAPVAAVIPGSVPPGTPSQEMSSSEKVTMETTQSSERICFMNSIIMASNELSLNISLLCCQNVKDTDILL